MSGLILNLIYNKEGKITECWLVNGEYFFFVLLRGKGKNLTIGSQVA